MPTAITPRAAYVHIPFCRRRCFYCDFAISVVGDRKRGDTSPTIARYIDTLLSEIHHTPLVGAQAAQPLKPLKTVFFGGGTPSLLSVEQLESILIAIDRRFGLASDAEISMEMDPATFDLSHASGYRAVGINRVSLGVQAFQDELLAAAGRFHRRSDILQAIETLRAANFTNISLDLICGLPHQTMAHWHESLQAAIALNPTHLSIYDLVVEPQTAFARYFTPGKAPLPSDETTIEMYKTAKDTLIAHGYDHYEICNYAKSGYEARHNLTYWRCEPNYGFGMGATSYLPHAAGPQRIDRPRTQSSYRQWVEQLVTKGETSIATVLPPSEQVLENVMMGLRLKPGISLDSVYRLYGKPGLVQMAGAIAPHIQTGQVVVESTDIISDPAIKSDLAIKLTSHSRIRLSDPEGFLVSNVVITDIFNALENALENVLENVPGKVDPR
ncbi:MAG: radical SAM family heme chaperone HemW [Phormidesmis sp.]